MGALQTMQRFVNTNEADAGFASVAFRNASFVLAGLRQHPGIYGINSKSFHLDISKDANRKLLEKQMIPSKVAWVRKSTPRCSSPRTTSRAASS